MAVLLALALELRGYEAVGIESDFYALLDPHAAVFDGIDAIVCDLLLGDVNGLSILAGLQKWRPEIRRVALTGSDDLADLAHSVADRVLIKVASMDAVVDALEDP
jgi:ActR/RegA family two-component response regulator